MIKKIIISLCYIPSLIWSGIFESNQLEDALAYIDPETWVLIDVDNTLIESSLHLGSAQWRDHIRGKAQSAGYSILESEKILDRVWFFVQSFIPVKLVDPAAPKFIQDLQKSQIRVLALTAREPIELDYTMRQISSVNIDLRCEFSENFSLPTLHPGLYQQGVIYCGENSKSEALIAFFQKIEQVPKKVVFIDDRLQQVEKLEIELEKSGVEFIGVRFSGSDQRVKAFDPQVADYQFSQLPKIISDKEAKALMVTDCSGKF